MWWIQKLNSSEVKYFVTTGKSYVVSRKNGDIQFPEDSSVSRKHCTVYVDSRNSCPFPVRTLTGLWLVDEGSKYGTFVSQGDDDWEQMEAGKVQVLKPGFVIRFGVLLNMWRVEYKPLFVCTSGVSGVVKQELKMLLNKLDGQYFNAWDNQCSLLIVNQLTLTVKAIMALVNGIPILTIDYLVKMVEAVEQNGELPDMANFKPIIAEAMLNPEEVSLTPNHNRKDLFKGLKFVFPTEEQAMNLSDIITAAGGTTELLALDADWKKWAADDTVLIQCPYTVHQEQNVARELKKISEFLKSQYGRRIVPESEIAQSVAYSSTVKYCNPKCTSFELRKAVHTISELGQIIQEETPHFMVGSQEGRGIIPDSVSQQSESRSQMAVTTNTLHGKRSRSPEALGPHKRLATEPRPSTSSSLPGSVTKCSKDLFVSDDMQGTTTAYNTATKDLVPTAPSAETYVPKTSKQQTLSNFWTMPELSGRTKQTKRKNSKNDDSEKQAEKKRKEDEERQLERERREDEGSGKRDRVVEEEASCVVQGGRRSVSVADIEDDEGYITVERNRGVKKLETDPLNTTIIMLSLVTLAHTMKKATADPLSGLTNVKTFKKQHVAGSGNRMAVLTTVDQRADVSDDEDSPPLLTRKKSNRM